MCVHGDQASEWADPIVAGGPRLAASIALRPASESFALDAANEALARLRGAAVLLPR
jgi:hypothetical protein